MFICYYETLCISEYTASQRFPNLDELRYPSFNSNLRIILHLFYRISPFKSPVALDVSRFAFPTLTWHNTFRLQQLYVISHTLLFLSAVGVAQCGLEVLVFETRLARNLPHPSRPAPRPNLPPVQWVHCVYFLRAKRPGRGLDHPPPSSVVVTEEWSYSPLSATHLHAFIASCILDYTFTFYFLFEGKYTVF
jgi:hypothetical protein